MFDLLLQVLGEGRLTDAAGRVADFRNCVILMTSNLGVEKFGLPRPGFETENAAVSAEQVVLYFTSEAARVLRPEMLNRIDRIVPFLPLDRKSLRKILDMEFRKIEKRYGLAARPITLEIDEAVHEKLMTLGYNPRFGARSLRRTLEQEFLIPLGKAFQKYPLRQSLTVRAFVENDEIRVTAVPTSHHTLDLSQNASAMATLDRIATLRQFARRLQEHSAIEEMKSRINRAETLKRKYRKRIRKQLPLPDEVRRFFASVEQIDKPYVEEVVRLHEQMVRAEEDAVFQFYSDKQPTVNLAELKNQYDDFVVRLYKEVHGTVDRVLLSVYGKNPAMIHETISIYKQIVEQLGCRCSWYAIEICHSATSKDSLEPDDRILGKSPCCVIARLLHRHAAMMVPKRNQIGQLLLITGRMAGPYFAEESGKVRFLESRSSKKTLFECSVRADMEPLEDFYPPLDSRGNPDISDDRILHTIDASRQDDSLVITLAESFRTQLDNRIEQWVME